jgi:hypothetical protein
MRIVVPGVEVRSITRYASVTSIYLFALSPFICCVVLVFVYIRHTSGIRY